MPAGSYTIKAIAYDNGGASTTSATIAVSVAAATAAPTTVSFQKSPDHATLVQFYLLEVFAAGANPEHVRRRWRR